MEGTQEVSAASVLWRELLCTLDVPSFRATLQVWQPGPQSALLEAEMAVSEKDQ